MMSDVAAVQMKERVSDKKNYYLIFFFFTYFQNLYISKKDEKNNINYVFSLICLGWGRGRIKIKK